MTPKPGAIALARATNAAFFLATWAYCLLAYSPFAYQQFLKPEVIPWIPDFLAIHAALFWLVLLITTLTLKPYIASTVALSRWLARGYLGVSAVVGVALIVRPLMLTIGNAPRSFVIGLLSLLPPLWLAAFDHVSAPPTSIEVTNQRRLLRTCLIAAACAWAV